MNLPNLAPRLTKLREKSQARYIFVETRRKVNGLNDKNRDKIIVPDARPFRATLRKNGGVDGGERAGEQRADDINSSRNGDEFDPRRRGTSPVAGSTHR